MFAKDLTLIDNAGGPKFAKLNSLRKNQSRRSFTDLRAIVPECVSSSTHQINKAFGQYCEWYQSTDKKVRQEAHDLKLFCMFIDSWS